MGVTETGSIRNRALAGLHFRLAAGAELERLRDLRKRVYATDWPEVSLDYVNDSQDEVAFQLVAVTEGLNDVVGAARVLAPTTRPFDTERYVQISRIVDPDRIPAEIGRLCLHHDWRRVQAPLVSAGLLALAVRVARKHGITDLILSALPDLVNFYRVGFFDPLDLTYDHPVWGHLRIMRLDLLALDDRLRGSSRPLARLLMDPTITNITV